MVIFFLSYCLLFNKITLNKGNVGTNHLNNRILLFVCNRKVIYYYYITLPSITITITITFGNFQSITITITGKSGYYYYNYILHITITPSLPSCSLNITEPPLKMRLWIPASPTCFDTLYRKYFYFFSAHFVQNRVAKHNTKYGKC